MCVPGVGLQDWGERLALCVIRRVAGKTRSFFAGGDAGCGLGPDEAEIVRSLRAALCGPDAARHGRPRLRPSGDLSCTPDELVLLEAVAAAQGEEWPTVERTLSVLATGARLEALAQAIARLAASLAASGHWLDRRCDAMAGAMASEATGRLRPIAAPPY